jgi:hypothetical protein
MAKLILTYRDYGVPGETSTAQFVGPDLTAVNFDAEVALQNALRDAVDGITLGTRINVQRIAQVSPAPNVQPASAFAQRESKWLVRYIDTVTGDKATHEIPTADLDLLDPTNGDKADMADPAVAAFVTAFENYALSPGSGTRGDTEVTEILFVGRRL